MKKKLLFFSLLLAATGGSLFAQNPTNVTGTLTDPSSVAYYPAQVTACLTPVTIDPTVGGKHVNPNIGANYCVGPVQTAPSGAFSMALYANGNITPGATQWIFTVQTAGSGPPAGKGAQTFSSAALTVSGTSQDVSTNINSVGPAQLNSSSSSSSPSLSIDATAAKYGLKYDTHYVFDASVTSGLKVITCTNTNDCNFTSTDLLGRPIAKVGQIVWGVCGPINFTNIFTSTLVVAQGTISTINSAQSITVSPTASGTCTNNLIVVWGDDDTGTATTGLMGAWNDAASICGRLLVPPLAILTQKGQFNTQPAGSCAVPVVTQANFEGVDLRGSGINSSVIIGTPNFDFTNGSGNSCGGGPTLNWCFFGSNGITVEDIQIWGGGNNLNGFNPSTMTYMAGVSPGTASGNAMMTKVHLGGWGAMAGVNLRGLIIKDIAINGFSELVSDGFGNIGCVVDQSLANSTEITFSNGSFCGDNGMVGAANAGTLFIMGGSVTSNGSAYGFCNGGVGACSAVYVSGIDGGAKFISIGDHFDNGTGGGTGVGVAVVGSTAEAVLSGAIINQQFPSSAATALYAHGGASIKVDNSKLSNGATSGSIFFIDDATSKIYEGDLNTIVSNNASATNLYNLVTGAVTIADAHSLQGACTGVATASQTLGLYGTGPNETLTTCTSTTIGGGIVISSTRTLMGLRVNATAAGVNGSSGVVTVLKNGAGTTLTCTLGATIFCQDGQHSVSVVAGDLISIQFTTQAADTLAGVKAHVEWN